MSRKARRCSVIDVRQHVRAEMQILLLYIGKVKIKNLSKYKNTVKWLGGEGNNGIGDQVEKDGKELDVTIGKK